MLTSTSFPEERIARVEAAAAGFLGRGRAAFAAANRKTDGYIWGRNV